jgi:voltage-gated potassium channel
MLSPQLARRAVSCLLPAGQFRRTWASRIRQHKHVIAILVRILGPHPRRHAVLLLVAAIACAVAGGALFAYTQGIAFTSGLYWAITTATTVGYGDVTPHNPAGRVVAAAVMLTTIPLLAAVFALLTGATAAAGVRRILAMAHHFPAGSYRIVIGMNPTVPAILDELVAAGDPVILVADSDPASVRAGVHLVRGDPTQQSVLREARLEGAQQALITGGTDGDVLVSAVLLRKQAPDLPAVALVSSASVREALHDLGIQQTISGHELVAHTLAKSLEAPHAGDMLAALVESDRHRLTELEADPATVGKPLSAVRGERSGLVLGIVHDGRFVLRIGEDPVVAAGDRLLVAGPARGAGRRVPASSS